jgi:TonB family protein
VTIDRSGGGPVRKRRDVPLANETFKRGWATRVAWSTVLAAAVHAALFMASPSWTIRVAPERTFEDEPLTITSLGSAGAELPGRPDAVAPRAVPAAPAVAASEADGTAPPATGMSSPTTAALWDRIAGGGNLSPTVVAPEPASERPAEAGLDAGRADALELLARRSTAELVPELDELVLERLSVMRPELALTDPSLGVLVRNPLEIDAFMRRTYDTGELSPGEPGLVSVALWIDERGNVRWAEIDQSSGRPDMDEVALELFREVAVFRPAREDGVPVSRSAIFWIRFPWVPGSPPFLPRGT